MLFKKKNVCVRVCVRACVCEILYKVYKLLFYAKDTVLLVFPI